MGNLKIAIYVTGETKKAGLINHAFNSVEDFNEFLLHPDTPDEVHEEFNQMHKVEGGAPVAKAAVIKKAAPPKKKAASTRKRK